MGRQCEICGKQGHVGHKVSHSNIKTSRRWHPNLQRVKALIDGTPRRIRVCTNCLKSGRVRRAL